MLTATNNIMNVKTNSFEKHRQNPDVTLSEYTKGLRVALGEEIQNLKKIYLDTNYWLELRDVILQRQQNEKYIEMLSVLRKGVNENKLICPISDENFYEILHQSDKETLISSAKIIDELSKGICLISTEERIKVEIMHFVYSMTGFDKNSFYHPDVFVWSKVSYIFGAIHPVLPHIPPEEELIVQKSILDHMWPIPFSEMIEEIGMDNILDMPKYKDITEEINDKKVRHHGKKYSFKNLFISEVAGVVDLYRNLFEDVLAYFFEKNSGENQQLRRQTLQNQV